MDKRAVRKPANFDRTNKEHARGLTVPEVYKRFTQTRQLPVGPVPPSFLNAAVLPSDMIMMLNLKRDIDDYFASLPSSLRSRFDNNSLNFISFIIDPRNLQEAENLGFIARKVAAKPPLGSPGNPIITKPLDPPAGTVPPGSGGAVPAPVPK